MVESRAGRGLNCFSLFLLRSLIFLQSAALNQKTLAEQLVSPQMCKKEEAIPACGDTSARVSVPASYLILLRGPLREAFSVPLD